MTGEQVIDDLKKLSSENLELIEKKVKHLTQNQMNWKSGIDSWSINEIFAHLNEYSRFYHPSFKSKIEKTKFRNPTENFISSPLGRAAWRSMKLGNARNVKRKFRALAAYNPSITPSLLKGEEFKLFKENQMELMEILESAKSINIRKAKAPISLSKIIKFRIGDAFYFVVYHNERHIQQVLNVINHPNFPKK
jgi:mRNA-degrading endonuclease RelE of RelBE toxin-antitoxin system